MKLITPKITAFLCIFTLYKLGFCQLTLENIFLYKRYEPKLLDEIHFLNQSPLFAILETSEKKQTICLYNAQNKQTKKIPLMLSDNWSNFSFSNSDKYILLESDQHYIYRRAYEANYFILNEQHELQNIYANKVMFPQFSTDDSKIAFVSENNLFYKDLKADKIIQITKDGKQNYIINGKSDWVYEEELQLTQAYKWSPKGTQIAYLKFDESKVKEYSFPVYGSGNYPQNFTYKYPKAGEENSKVTLWLYDLKKKKNTAIKLPTDYEYIARLYWNFEGDELLVLTLNRKQNELQLLSYNLSSKSWHTCYKEQSDTYIDLPDNVLFLKDNSFFITSEKEGYNQLYHYTKNGELIKKITTGKQNIAALYSVDEKTKKVYYQSVEKEGLETAIKRCQYDNLNQELLSQLQGDNSAVFSKDGSFYFQTYSSDSTPQQISLHNLSNDSFVLLIDNKALKDSLKGIPRKTYTTLPVNGNNLNAYLIKPANFDSTKKYPLLMYVYGGPGNIEVSNKWQSSRLLWLNLLAEQGYFIACVDNRGSGGKSSDFKKTTYLHLGKYETQDQIAAAQYLGNLPYIDKSRIGIFGWSYGGFMAANCLFEGNDVFKLAIAGAPVSNWRFYDNIYTERYMQKPEENQQGYQEYCPVASAKKLKGKFLLVHGTADDNVHFQNSIQLIDALQQAHKPFDLYIYPDKAHSISGSATRFDLYSRLTQFIFSNL